MIFRIVEPRALERLFAFALDASNEDPGADGLGTILKHQLDAPLIVDLGEFAAESEDTPNPSSFRDLFTQASPPVAILELVKRFAKGHCVATPATLPREVATVIYYAAIAIARARAGVTISTHSDQKVLVGLQWALGLDWLDDGLRQELRWCRQRYKASDLDV